MKRDVWECVRTTCFHHWLDTVCVRTRQGGERAGGVGGVGVWHCASPEEDTHSEMIKRFWDNLLHLTLKLKEKY